jgi:AcrR family transcriptional regulator
MPKKRGRKEFKPTAAQRRKVELYRFAGMSEEDIASAIGCSRPTLTKHFPEELAVGAAKKRAEAMDLLWKAARGRKPNVAAIKKLIEIGALADAAGATGDSQKPAVPNNGKLGKKQLAQIAATQVGGEGSEWGNDLDPPAGSLPN